MTAGLNTFSMSAPTFSAAASSSLKLNSAPNLDLRFM